MAKSVVITGSSSGFGKLLALQLARRGDRAYATLRATQGKNATVAAELSSLARNEGIDLRVLELDVTSTASVDAGAVVGVDAGVRERNATVEPFDAGVLAAFGLAEFATLTSRAN